MKESSLLFKYRHYLYAFLVLLPTFAHMNSMLYLVFSGVVIFFERKSLIHSLSQFRSNYRDKKYLPIYLLALILMFSFVNKLINGEEVSSLRGYYSSFYLLPVLLCTSFLLKEKRFFKGIVGLVTIGVLVAIAEYFVGNRSFFVELGDYQYIESYTLFYDSRVYGLSANSSVIAYKIMLAFFLIDYIKLSRAWNWILRIVLFFGLLITFSRTVLIAVLIYWIVSSLVALFQSRKEVLKSSAFQFYLVVFIGLIAFNSDLKNQFSRGGMKGESVEAGTVTQVVGVDNLPNCIPLLPAELDPQKQKWGSRIFSKLSSVQSSGRKLIWLNYLDYLQDNLWFGNGSDKLYAKAWVEKNEAFKKVHAHNSFIELLTSNGLIIFLLYLVFYFSWMKFDWNTLPFIIGILIYSMANFGIFWGFSLMDLLFLMFLRHKFVRE